MKKIYSFLAVLLLALIQFSTAQVSVYSFTQFPGSYSAITGGTVFGDPSTDDQRFVDPTVPLGGFSDTGPGIPIGFNFTFNGNVYDVFALNANGWLSFGNSSVTPSPVNINSSTSYNPISATSTAPGILQNRFCALARDLQGQTGSEIRVQTIGFPPNQTCVIQFTNYRRYLQTGDSFDFQIRLEETSNTISVVYGTFTTSVATAQVAQVGLRGQSNADFNNRIVNTLNPWSSSIPGTLNSSSVNFLSTLTPSLGLTYRWIPPAPCTGSPASGTAAISSSTGCPNTNFTLTSTGATSGPGIQYQWFSSSTPTGPWSSITGATSTIFTTSVSATTYFQMVVTCTNSSQSATTSVVGYTVVNPGPCVCAGYPASSANSTFDGEIFNVTFGTLNNNSNCTTVAPGPGSLAQRYSNYAGFVAAPTVMQGQSVPFSVALNTCGGNFGTAIKIFIDFNQNGVFTDPGEEVFVSAASIVGPFTESGNITIPLTANVGTTRMRVVQVETTLPSSISSSGTYGWGETEDYCIDIVSASACTGAPNSGTASVSSPTGCPNSTVNVTATGLTIGTGLQYQWYSSPTPTGPWTSITNATNTAYNATVTSTTYFQMVTTCTNSSQSATTSVTGFTVVNPGPCICNTYGSSGATSAADEDIFGVTFGTLNNTSNCTVPAPGPGSVLNRYANYAGFVAAPQVMQGQSVPFNIDINTCGGWFGMQFDIYIDYNQNGLFTDPGELAHSNTNANQGPNTGNITIPITASVGITRMRIVAVEGVVPGPTGPYTWGETEDYCIDIIAATNCSGTPNPGLATISTNTGCVTDVFNLGATGITVGNGIQYQWQSAPSASGPWTNMPGGTIVNFTATASSTTFYQLVTTCTISSLSATSSIVSFTPANCYLMSTATITTCSGTLYDSGGPNNNYQNNESYTLTLVPATPNAMAQLTFNSFNTESGFDYLYIYDGNSTAAPLIGQYDGNTLPPPITATNSSGILTLVFTSDFIINLSGWDATISCSVLPTCSGSPNSGTATISSPTACLSSGASLGATGVTLASGIQYQWYSSSSPTGPWTSVPSATMVNVNVTPTTVTYYQLVTTCTVSAQSATSSVVSFTPVNCYIMSNNTITTCGGTVYDSGGPSANYSNNESYTLTILPSTPGSSVSLTFNAFDTEANFDYLYIYDGTTTAAPLLGQYDGNTLPPNTTAGNSSGALTLLFTSDGSVTFSGFEIALSCSNPCAGPPAAPSATGALICSGSQATLTASPTGTAQWYSSASSTVYIAQGNTFVTPILSSNTTYYVKDSTSCGISSVTAVNVTVNPAPSLTISPATTSLCAGQSLTITASGASTYSWSTSASTSSVVVSPTVTTSYTVTGSAPACPNTSAVVNVTVHALPSVSLSAAVSTICAINGSIALTGNPPGGTYSGVAVTGSLLSVTNPGTYTPMYTYTNTATGCFNSATTTVIVANCTGLSESYGVSAEQIRILPNPNSGAFVIETTNTLAKDIELSDVAGRVVYRKTSEESSIQVDISHLANGWYQLKINDSQGLKIFKIIKQ